MSERLQDLAFIKIATLRREADDMEAIYLRKAGWKHTSQTPGSRWMWEGVINGQLFLVGTKDAARIQEHEDREKYFDEHPEELAD